MGMQKVIHNDTYIKCLSIAKTALSRPNGLFIQCPSKAAAVRQRALFYSLRKKLGYGAGQIPAEALGLYTIEFILTENENGTATLHIRRAGVILDELKILDENGEAVEVEGVAKDTLHTEKLEYVIQLDRIRYFLRMACPSRSHMSNDPSLYLMAQYLYKRGTRIMADIPQLAESEEIYRTDNISVEERVAYLGDKLEAGAGELIPPEAWERPAAERSEFAEKTLAKLRAAAEAEPEQEPEPEYTSKFEDVSQFDTTSINLFGEE